MKLGSSGWRRKVTDELGKFWFNLERIKEAFQLQWNFPTSEEIFQLEQKVSNFRLYNFSFFPIAVSNYTYPLSKFY